MFDGIRLLRQVPAVARIDDTAGQSLAFAVLSRSGLVDPQWYSRQLGRATTMSRVEATAHYVLRGRVRGLSPHPLFEPEYVDPTGWRTTSMDPLTRYLRDRKNWATPTHPWFDGAAYLGSTPAARAHQYGPLGTSTPPQTRRRLSPYCRFIPTTRQWRSPGGRRGTTCSASAVPDVEESRSRVGHPTKTTRVAGRISVLVRSTYDWQRARRCLAALLAETDAGDLEIIVADNASRRSVGTILAAIGATDACLDIMRHRVRQSATLTRNLSYAQSTGEVVVFLDDIVLIQRGWLPPLLRALDTPDVLAVQPLLILPDHTVHSAGMVSPRRGTLPVDFLADHPVDDARRLGAHPEVSAVTAAALAIRATDFAALDGFDADLSGWSDVGLCLRL